MIIMQIAIDSIPHDIKICMDSVRAYAKSNKIEYVLLDRSYMSYNIRKISTGSKKIDEYSYNRTLSEIIRIDYCSSHINALYCDWDIVIKPGFKIMYNTEQFGNPPDAIYYNANNTDRYSAIKKQLKEEYIAGDTILEKHLIPSLKEDKPLSFDNNTYRHLYSYRNEIAKSGCYNRTVLTN